MRRKRIIDILEIIALTVSVGALIAYPEQSVSAAKNGVELCVNVIIPSLFPFFVLSALIVETGVTHYLGKFLEPIMRPLFGVNGACSAAFALGFVGGYPVGAKTVIALYDNGSCNKTEAERLLSFCNNSGPAFIFGVVGAGVFASGKIGLLLYLAHTAASILVGIMFRFHGGNIRPVSASHRARVKPPKRLIPAFSGAVKSSFFSTINICGFVIFFTLFIKLLFISGAIPVFAHFLGILFAPLGFDASWAERLLTGFIELTSGVWTLRSAGGEITSSVAMAAFMLGWAGLSVHSQVLSFIGESGLSVKTYIAGKLLQGVISAVLIFIMGQILVIDVPAASVLAYQVTLISKVTFWKALTVSLGGAMLVFFILLFTVWRIFRFRDS